ncbi:aromatic amino acid transport family protein [Ornithinimicrobium cryptoxanthini]|uniref:Amino acid transporter transmembrane domain-containing protein n=1 Tax=Ornithinimicrobium cryptoxanthini TaxID=2934161 RepID=A0ABY4YHL2_9MICO|nr:aromatic amino acid transport family protein [Ornithinimicrobium cryptoxanthini]USQ76273.1 hypothetical protein NF557_17070 [Ornithinimicrobium cryptoxanthini]
MTDTEDAQPSLTAAEVLRGLTGQRVSTALHAIESRAGLLALTRRHVALPAICENMAATAERDYVTALTTGAELPTTPRAQHLERSAPAWAHLVPTSPSTRADLAHAFAARHPARRQDVPLIRAALGVAEPEVSEALTRRHGIRPDDLWADRLPLRERVRWWSTRMTDALDRLSPFWAAFALTLTQTVGAGVLALPIALAGVGPFLGLLLIVVIGLANVLSVAAIAESVTRTGTVRWAGAFLGGVVRQHLGRHAAHLTQGAIAVFGAVVMIVYYLGLAGTLEEVFGVPESVWIALLFLVTVGFVWRGRFSATIASALLVGAVNLLIIGLLTVLALASFDASRWARADTSPTGGGFDPTVLGLVFGVLLASYFGHTTVAAGARTMLERDPGGRSIIRGAAAAMLVVILVYAGWTLVVLGAVDADRLEAESGTALVPLAETAGPLVLVLGTVFVIGAMGMAAVHSSIGLHSLTVELLEGLGRRGGPEPLWRRLLAVAPLAAVFVLVEVLVLTGRASFTTVLSLLGALTIPLLTGVIPVLLIAATQRRGDYVPASTLGWVASPPVLVAVYLLFVAAVAAHGLVIWTGAFERGLAFLVVALVVVVTVAVFRSGAFRPLTTLEVRRDHDLGLDALQVTSHGRPVSTDLRTAGPAGGDSALAGAARLPERTAVAELPALEVDTEQLSVWAHEVDAWGSSTPLQVAVSVDGQPVPLAADGTGSVDLPADGDPTITIDLGGTR